VCLARTGEREGTGRVDVLTELNGGRLDAKDSTECIRVAVATYNVHRCIGRDGRQDPDRIARVVRETDASVIGLQEIESFQRGEPQHHQLTQLVRGTGLIAVAGPALYRPQAHYGNSLLTRERLLRVQRHDLSVAGREPRGAVEVDLEIEGCRIRTIVTHLGLRAAERCLQTRQLLDIVASQPGVPTIVLGDFNEWLFCGSRLSWLRRELGKSRGRRSFPARFPILALDRVWVTHPGRVLTTRAHRSLLARVASDHLPMTAVVEFSRPTLAAR
jgi:endonuclease/exonuclease/phosphatase family metal-dependent hydrolase